MGETMGVHDSAHPGQRLASERAASTTTDQQCGFCETAVSDADASERVEHVLPANGGRDTRTELYCSPGCFVQQMDRVAHFE
jgi:hypothetical protein